MQSCNFKPVSQVRSMLTLNVNDGKPHMTLIMAVAVVYHHSGRMERGQYAVVNRKGRHDSPPYLLQEKGVAVLEGTAVKKVEQGKLSLAGGEALGFDECLWCTQAGAPAWLGSTGLPLGTQSSWQPKPYKA